MTGRRFFGAILVVVGVGLILERLGLVTEFSVLMAVWWPIILVIGSIVQMISIRRFSGGSLIVMIIGLLLLLKNLEVVDVSIYKLIWPTILVLVGMSFLFTKGFNLTSTKASNEDTIDYFVMFSGIEERLASDSFKGGTVTTLFGGSEIDLRSAQLGPEGAFIEVVVAFGGVEIKVPEDWNVVVKGVPIFGGWTNKAKSKEGHVDSDRVLNINCIAIFGGMEIG